MQRSKQKIFVEPNPKNVFSNCAHFFKNFLNTPMSVNHRTPQSCTVFALNIDKKKIRAYYCFIWIMWITQIRLVLLFRSNIRAKRSHYTSPTHENYNLNFEKSRLDCSTQARITFSPFQLASMSETGFFAISLLQMVKLEILHAKNLYPFAKYVNYLHNFANLYIIIPPWWHLSYILPQYL